MKLYHPTLDLKINCHICFKMLSSYLRSNCRYLRYLRYIDLKNWQNPLMTFPFHQFWACLVDYSMDIRIPGNLRSTFDESFAASMTFYHAIWPYSVFKCERVIRSLDNPFSSPETHVISWVDSVIYYWLDIIWIHSAI